jgi:DNA-binding PadR family transcriptional regulator
MKMQIDQKEQREVFYYILAYLSDNPDAGDTMDGIVEWWLLDQRIKFATRNVSEAVSKLVSEGLIVEHTEADSRIIYRVNNGRKKTIRAILNKGKNFV